MGKSSRCTNSVLCESVLSKKKRNSSHRISARTVRSLRSKTIRASLRLGDLSAGSISTSSPSSRMSSSETWVSSVPDRIYPKKLNSTKSIRNASSHSNPASLGWHSRTDATKTPSTTKSDSTHSTSRTGASSSISRFSWKRLGLCWREKDGNTGSHSHEGGNLEIYEISLKY